MNPSCSYATCGKNVYMRCALCARIFCSNHLEERAVPLHGTLSRRYFNLCSYCVGQEEFLYEYGEKIAKLDNRWIKFGKKIRKNLDK